MKDQLAVESGLVRRLIDLYFDAWREKTSDDVLNFFSDDASATLFGDGSTLAGKNMVGEHWIIPMMKKYSGCHHQVLNAVEAGDQIVVEWLFTAMRVSSGKESRLRGCSVYRVSGASFAALMFTSFPSAEGSRPPARVV